MFSIGVAKRRLMRVSALGMALVLVGCGGGGDDDVDASAPSAPGSTSGASPTTVAVATTALSSPTTGGRSSVPTTLAFAPADKDITAELIPEHTMYNDPTFKPLAINGVSYVNALQMYSQKTPAKLEINAGRARSRFRGSLGISDSQSSSSAHLVEISFDNAAPAFSAVVGFGETKDIDLDVTNVLRIRITVSSTTAQDGYVAIGNPRFA